MRELGIAFEEKIVPFGSDSNWDEFRNFNPAGKVPCLHQSDDKEVVWDTLAIIEYLAERHAGVWPIDGKARTWARCAAAEMHSGFGVIRQTCPMHVGFRIQLNETSAAFNHDIARLNELWNQGLDQFGGPFLAGAKFTAIDAYFAPVVFRAQSYGLALNEKSKAYAKHLLQTSAMQQWQSEALKESWREPGHEDAALAAGSLLADLRSESVSE